jgi:predicted Rossmann-fold nucleotide-binding protein
MSARDLDKWLSQFPDSARLPFKLRPSQLYTVAQLYDKYDPTKSRSWESCYDYLNYLWFTEPGKNSRKPRKLSTAEAIAARLHDTGIEHAIDDFLRTAATRTVGFMGGHGTLRTDSSYAQIAGMARTLKRAGLMIVTGGGPGLMEAANLGAFLAPYDDAQLAVALSVLKDAPKAQDASDPDAADKWLRTAAKVRGDLLDGDWRSPTRSGSANLGIPTWLYGHEPPNLFSTAIGKYFYNSVREDGLITVASGGLVFGPGEAGTVQEVFQDATLNYYASDNAPTPMVFLGTDYWDPGDYDDKTPAPLDDLRKPVYPLIQALAKGHFESSLLLSDDATEITDFLLKTGIKPKAAPHARLAEARLLRQFG